MKCRHILGYACLSAIAWGTVVFPAHAASADGADKSSQPGTANQSDTAPGIPEILVTARRTSENIQRVPLSIAAVQPEVLAQNNIQTTQDLARVVPSLSTYGPYAIDIVTILRGQGSFIQGGVPAVMTYLNDVPLPGSQGGPGMFYDLQNVQVLKGAQGTLFGRNSTGGAVLFQTQKPANELGGYMQFGVGNYGNLEGTAALNLPIVDDAVLLRVAGNVQVRDGYAKTLGLPGFPNGLDLNNRNMKAFRATLVIKPVDGLKNETMVDYYQFKTHGDNVVLSGVNNDFFDNTLPGVIGSDGAAYYKGVFLTALAQQQALGNRTIIPQSVYAPNYKQGLVVINTTTYDVTDNLTLKNIFSYSRVRARKPFDGDGTAIQQLDFGPVISDDLQSQYTEELQLQGKAIDGRLNYTLGGFYLKAPKNPFYVVDITQFFGFDPVNQATRVFETSKAVYGQLTYELIDNLHVTAGLRYTKDERAGETRILKGSYPTATCATPLPDAPTNDPCLASKVANSSKMTGNFSVDYQITPATMVYGAIRRGYRAGGPNTQAVSAVNATFQPEMVTDYEVGLKTDVPVGSMTVRANLAVFHSDLTNQQSPLVLIEPERPTTAISIVKNVGKSSVTGAEAQIGVRVTPEFNLGANVSYVDENIDLPPGVARQGLSKWQYALTASYERPLAGNAGSVAASTSFNGQSGFYTGSSTTDPFAYQKGFGLLNASLSWNDLLGTKLSLTVFGTNILNKLYKVGSYGLYQDLGYSATSYGEPRMYGLRLRYDF